MGGKLKGTMITVTDLTGKANEASAAMEYLDIVIRNTIDDIKKFYECQDIVWDDNTSLADNVIRCTGALQQIAYRRGKESAIRA